jgi:hypothetical protein
VIKRHRGKPLKKIPTKFNKKRGKVIEFSKELKNLPSYLSRN